MRGAAEAEAAQGRCQETAAVRPRLSRQRRCRQRRSAAATVPGGAAQLRLRLRRARTRGRAGLGPSDRRVRAFIAQP